MTTTILVTTVFTPNLDPANSLNRVLEHLEQTDEGLRNHLSQLDQDVQVTTTLLNIADVFEKVKRCATPTVEQSHHEKNGFATQNGGTHNGNGAVATAHNGVHNGKQSITSESREGDAQATEKPLVLEELLEQIQQGKLELYLHLAPTPSRSEHTGEFGSEKFEDEEIGEHFLQNPFLY